jgi:hypothetical protein
VRRYEPVLYEYKMVQIAPAVIIQGANQDRAAAEYLQKVVSKHAHVAWLPYSEQAGDWEFFRLDSFDVVRGAGCLAAIFGAKGESTKCYVLTFRREV